MILTIQGCHRIAAGRIYPSRGEAKNKSSHAKWY